MIDQDQVSINRQIKTIRALLTDLETSNDVYTADHIISIAQELEYAVRAIQGEDS